MARNIEIVDTFQPSGTEQSSDLLRSRSGAPYHGRIARVTDRSDAYQQAKERMDLALFQNDLAKKQLWQSAVEISAAALLFAFSHVGPAETRDAMGTIAALAFAATAVEATIDAYKVRRAKITNL